MYQQTCLHAIKGNSVLSNELITDVVIIQYCESN